MKTWVTWSPGSPEPDHEAPAGGTEGSWNSLAGYATNSPRSPLTALSTSACPSSARSRAGQGHPGAGPSHRPWLALRQAFLTCWRRLCALVPQERCPCPDMRFNGYKYDQSRDLKLLERFRLMPDSAVRTGRIDTIRKTMEIYQVPAIACCDLRNHD
jgi:hypothetical protein